MQPRINFIQNRPTKQIAAQVNILQHSIVESINFDIYLI